MAQRKLHYMDGSEYQGSVRPKSLVRHGYGTLTRRTGGGKLLNFTYTGQFEEDTFGDGIGDLTIYDPSYKSGPNDLGSKILHFKGSFVGNKMENDGTPITVVDDELFESHFGALP